MATVRLQLRRGEADQWVSANPTLAAGEIGIETDTNTFKFGDGSTPWNSLSYALSQTVDDYILLSTKGVANGVASLDSSGLIPSAQLPPLAKVTVSAVANQGARLALTAEAGDIAIQSDNGQSYVLSASPASTDANWKALVGSEAVVDTVEASLIAGTGLDKTYNDASGTITIDIDSTVATKTYADQAEADAITTAASDATTKANAAQAAATSAAASALSTHEADTTSVHGIADTSLLATTANVATAKSEAISAAATAAGTALSTHEADTTSVHGIADTSLLATTANVATAKSEAISAAATAAGTALSDHGTDTTGVHGIADTAELATKTYANSAVSTAVSALTKSSVGLSNVDNTSDLAKPVSSATLTALDLKAPLASPALTGDATAVNLTLSGNLTVNGSTSTINSTTLTVQDKDIVLGQTATPTDAAADNGGIILKGTTDKSIKYSIAKSAWDISENINIPADKSIKINNIEVLTLTTVLGKSLPGVVVGTTETQNLTNKTLNSPIINTPTGITKSDVGLSNVDNTTDASKPVSTATQTALDLKAPLASPTFTGSVTLPSGTVNSGMIADGAIVDSDINAAAAIAQSKISGLGAALDLKAPLASPTFTGTVSGVTKAMVGLGSADNTSDAAKPVSTATQTALDLKAPLASPTFTGTVTLPVGTITTGMIADGTIATADIADVAVSTAKIADAAITTAKIADDSITSAKIVAGTIVNSDINATAAIDWTKLAISSTVDATELGYVNGVTSAIQTQIDTKLSSATAASTYAPLASPTFTGTVTLPTGTITTGMIADGAVATADIADVAVSTAKIADSAVTSAKIADLTIVDGDISASAAIAQSKISGLTSALDLKAPLASPALTGVPTAPLAATGTNTTQVATTSFVQQELNTLTTGAPAAMNTLDELAAALGDDANYAATITTALSAKAPLASPTFTGTVTVAASGVAFTDGTQTKKGVPSLTTTTTNIGNNYNLNNGGGSLHLNLIDQLINIGGAYTITVPADADTLFPLGASIQFWQSGGAGGATFSPASAAVTIHATPGNKLRAQYSSATLTKVGANTWLLAGDLKV